MHPFEEAISVIGTIVGAIVFLTLFFMLVGWIGRKGKLAHNRIGISSVLNEQTPCTVHLSGNARFDNVRLIGLTDSTSSKGPFPFELNGMLILEHPDGRRTLVHAKNVRMIEVGPK